MLKDIFIFIIRQSFSNPLAYRTFEEQFAWARLNTMSPDTSAEKFENLERINLIRETNRNFDS